MNTFLIACSETQENSLLLRNLENSETRVNKTIKDLSFGDFYSINSKNEKVLMSKCRQFIFKKYNEGDITNFKKNSIKINWDNTLPAFKRYKGKVFNQIPDVNFKNCNCENWVECNCNNKWFEILILSPLWGWIKHTDYIPKYNLDMNDKINIGNKDNPQHIKLWELWSVCFYNILQVNSNRKYYDVNNCCDLLFSSCMYRPAIQYNKNNSNFDTQQNAKSPLSNCNGDNIATDRGDALGNLLNDKLNKIIKEKTGREYKYKDKEKTGREYKYKDAKSLSSILFSQKNKSNFDDLSKIDLSD